MRILDFIKDLISPKRCYNCKKKSSYLCLDCVFKIWYHKEICPVCKTYSKDFLVHSYCENQKKYYDQVIILFNYNNQVIQKLIKDLKYYNRKDISQDIAYYLKEKLYLHNKNIDISKTIIIFPPSYFLKKFIRWYNQAELISYYLSKETKIPYNSKIFKKLKWTKSQSKLSKNDRVNNIKWAFLLNQKEFFKYKDYDFIIVDDVFSTGSTINELSKILKQNWVKHIIALIFASN